MTSAAAQIPALRDGATLGLIAPAGPPREGTLEQVPGLLARHAFVPRSFPPARARPTSASWLPATARAWTICTRRSRIRRSMPC